MQPPPQPPFPGQPQQPGWPNQPQPGWQSPQYGVPPQPPKRNRQALYWSLGAVAAVLVVAVIIVLAVQPWKKSSGGVQTFELDRAITVEIRVPSGWVAREVLEDGETGVLIAPAGDDRSFAGINDDWKKLRRGESGTPIHVIVVNASSCARNSPRSWQVGAIDQDEEAQARSLQRRALWLVDGKDCARMISTDMDRSSPSPTASDLLASLAGSDAVVPRHDGTRPSIRPSGS